MTPVQWSPMCLHSTQDAVQQSAGAVRAGASPRSACARAAAERSLRQRALCARRCLAVPPPLGRAGARFLRPPCCSSLGRWADQGIHHHAPPLRRSSWGENQPMPRAPIATRSFAVFTSVRAAGTVEWCESGTQSGRFCGCVPFRYRSAPRAPSKTRPQVVERRAAAPLPSVVREAQRRSLPIRRPNVSRHTLRG